MSRPITSALQLGAALREQRIARGLTQAQLAEHASVSRAFVIDLEKGARPRAELTRVLAVVRALDLAITLDADTTPSFTAALDDLLGGSPR